MLAERGPGPLSTIALCATEIPRPRCTYESPSTHARAGRCRGRAAEPSCSTMPPSIASCAERCARCTCSAELPRALGAALKRRLVPATRLTNGGTNAGRARALILSILERWATILGAQSEHLTRARLERLDAPISNRLARAGSRPYRTDAGRLPSSALSHSARQAADPRHWTRTREWSAASGKIARVERLRDVAVRV